MTLETFNRAGILRYDVNNAINTSLQSNTIHGAFVHQFIILLVMVNKDDFNTKGLHALILTEE
jgi:hypothetical protein